MGFTKELVIESKLFSLVNEGCLLRITKRGWKIEHELLLGISTMQWLGKALEDCLKGEKMEFYTTIRDGY